MIGLLSFTLILFQNLTCYKIIVTFYLTILISSELRDVNLQLQGKKIAIASYKVQF